MRPAWVSPPRGAPLTRTSPTAQLASSGRRGPEPAPGKSRRPAEARPGPELPFPPARRRASAAAEPGPPRPPTPGSPPTRAAPSAHGSLAGTQRAASSRRPERGFAPSSTSSFPALPPPPLPEKAPKKPPHFPSRLRRRSAGRPFGQERPLEGERPRAPSVTGATRRRGRGYGVPEGSSEPARPERCALRAHLWLPGPPPVLAALWRPLPAPPLEPGARILGEFGGNGVSTGWGRRTNAPTGPLPGRFSELRAGPETRKSSSAPAFGAGWISKEPRSLFLLCFLLYLFSGLPCAS